MNEQQKDKIEYENGDKFKELHPEYRPTEQNAETLIHFVRSQIPVGQPFTVENLEFALGHMAPVLEKWTATTAQVAGPNAEELALATGREEGRGDSDEDRAKEAARLFKKNRYCPLSNLKQRATDERRENMSHAELVRLDQGYTKYI